MSILDAESHVIQPACVGNAQLSGLAFDEHPDSSHVGQPHSYFARKSAAVRLMGCALLVGFSPAILLLSLVVKATSRGPAWFRQTRVGKDGQLFTIFKLRTMQLDAEDASGPTWCTSRDSRITPVGRVLRFLHLDELPQLINVARGEMDLIGPRPERPEIIELHQLTKRVEGYELRHRVLPGVTGLAQINLPADQTIDCVHRKVSLDREYIETACLWLDIRILLCTAFRMLGVRHGVAVRALGLTRPGATAKARVDAPANATVGASNRPTTAGSRLTPNRDHDEQNFEVERSQPVSTGVLAAHASDRLRAGETRREAASNYRRRPK